MFLFLPATFIYESVDGILCKLEKKEKHAVISGLQITLNENHRSIEDAFIKRWNEWAADLGCDQVELEFVWIMEKVPEKRITDEKLHGMNKDGRNKGKRLSGYRRVFCQIDQIHSQIGEYLARGSERFGRRGSNN